MGIYTQIKDDTLLLKGLWTIEHFKEIEAELKKLNLPFNLVDASRIEKLDFYGAYLIDRYLSRYPILHLKEEYKKILEAVKEKPRIPAPRRGVLATLVDTIYQKITDFYEFIVYTGLVFYEGITHIRSLEFRNLVKELEEAGPKAIGIITVLTFLIGVVIAYQSSAQLATFGANIFIVDLVSIAITRELSPLIVGIVMAGRSASSYTAEVGLMKVSEEIDLMRTLGISPYASIVLPKLLSSILLFPLLITYGDVVGIVGGMLVSQFTLGISPEQFLRRLDEVLYPDHFWAGVIKGPIFGGAVALIGTYEGFKVEKKAESIGFSVTRSVVKAIFSIIFLDALFSVIYRWLNI
ncbi:MlaE family ABC transporter permease [Aquifex sp.]